MAQLVAYLPALTVAALLLACSALFSPDHPRARQLVRVTRLVFIVRYHIWRAFFTLPAPDWSVGVAASYALWVVELYVAWVTNRRVLIRRGTRSIESDVWKHWRADDPPRVAVLIPTYNETEDILFRTIVGASSLAYSNYEVWVLDDGKRDWLRDLCARFNVNYLTREKNVGYKSGNLNAAASFLATRDRAPEFFAVFDADFVPRRAFLQRVMPLFHEPSVGIVQTPQFFFNPDPFQQAFSSKEVWPDDARFYMEGMQPYLDGDGRADCVGTSFVARRSAIDAIGGFATESVADDTLTSIKLRGAGFTTVYLDECLSSGLATEGLREYLSQRGRWCLGNLQITFSRWGAVHQLKGWRRLRRLALDFSWPVGGIINWIWYLLPILFFFTGYALIETDTESAISYMMPLFVVRFGHVWLFRGTQLPVLQEAITFISSFAIVPAAIQGLREPEIRGFRVTEKGRLRDRHAVYWRLFIPFIVLMVLILSGIVVSFMPHSPLQQMELGGLRTWIYVFAIQRLIILYICASVCVERPRHRSYERFPLRAPAKIVTASGAETAAMVTEVSEWGCQVTVEPRLPPGTTCTIVIDQFGEYAARVKRNVGRHAVGLEFLPDEVKHAARIRELYGTSRYFDPPRSWTFRRAMVPVLRSLFSV